MHLPDPVVKKYALLREQGQQPNLRVLFEEELVTCERRGSKDCEEEGDVSLAASPVTFGASLLSNVLMALVPLALHSLLLLTMLLLFYSGNSYPHGTFKKASRWA
jgi:hypothetical protein